MMEIISKRVDADDPFILEITRKFHEINAGNIKMPNSFRICQECKDNEAWKIKIEKVKYDRNN